MSNSINLSINLEELSSNQVKKLSAFIHSFDRDDVQDHPVTQSVDEANTVKEEPVKKTRAKKNTTVQEGAFKGQERTESQVDDYEAAKEKEVNEPTDADDDFLGGEEQTVTLDDIKAAFQPLLQSDAANRPKLKAELERLGAANLPALKPEHFGTFMTFIKSLK